MGLAQVDDAQDRPFRPPAVGVVFVEEDRLADAVEGVLLLLAPELEEGDVLLQRGDAVHQVPQEMSSTELLFHPRPASHAVSPEPHGTHCLLRTLFPLRKRVNKTETSVVSEKNQHWSALV